MPFRLCWLWGNRDLVWDIIRRKFAKHLLSVFFLPNEVISYVYKGQSICSVLVNMQHHVVAQLGLSLAHFDPFRFWLFWCLINRYYISCWLFLAEQKYDFFHLLNSKVHRTEQQYIILLWSTILWNFNFHWQLSILVEKFHFCQRVQRRCVWR